MYCTVPRCECMEHWCFVLYLGVSAWNTIIYFTTITKQVHTTYIIHARWHRCLCLCKSLCGGRSIQRKPTCLTWWPHDHLTCDRCTLKYIDRETLRNQPFTEIWTWHETTLHPSGSFYNIDTMWAVIKQVEKSIKVVKWNYCMLTMNLWLVHSEQRLTTWALLLSQIICTL